MAHLGKRSDCMLKCRGASTTAKIAKPDPDRHQCGQFEAARKASVAAGLASWRGDDQLGDAQVNRLKSQVRSWLSDYCAPELDRRLRSRYGAARSVELRTVVDEVLNLFSGLENERAEFNFLRDRVPFLEPVEHILGRERQSTIDAEGFTHSTKVVEHKAYYVPMSKALMRLLQYDPVARENVLRTQEEWAQSKPARGTERRVYADICDGDLFREHPELGDAQRGMDQGGRIRTCIILYYDGLEVSARPPARCTRTADARLLLDNTYMQQRRWRIPLGLHVASTSLESFCMPS